jgi:hypothetical protein
LPNGLEASSNGYGGTVRIPTTIASNPVNNVYRALTSTEGSLINNVGSAQNEPKWTKLSIGTYVSNIRNGRTGARRLDLPLVADVDSDGNPDAQPIELIRRPAQNSNEHVANKNLYDQRFYAQASLRILLSDTVNDIMTLPRVDTAVQPLPLFGPLVGMDEVRDYGTTPPDALRSPIGNYEAPGWLPSGSNYLPVDIQKGAHNESVVGGYIKIEMQRQLTPTTTEWVDVTREILGFGISGRNLADRDIAITSRWNSVPSGTSDTCPEPHPNAVMRLQRIRDIPADLQPCGVSPAATPWNGVPDTVSPNEHDYWPLALYDPREGHTRDGLSDTLTDLALGGIIHYVELDVRNLKRWLRGEIGASGNQARNDNGFIVYFSDRRNNRNAAGLETGEYGWEDIVNPNSAAGTPNGVLDVGEDLNGNGVLDTYGNLPRNVPTLAMLPLTAAARVTTLITGANIALVARANRPLFFRRALKLTNGGIYAPFTNGLTIASENPVYVQGDFNATAASTTAAGAIPSALIADSVTLLSNAWNDIRSFTSPGQAQGRRNATTTGYRMAVVAGKSLAFPKPASTDASFGSDGGAHNFMRNLEYWTTGGIIQRYRGSLVSFFISRQATGTFKCCAYDVYNKPDVRDMAFDTDFLLPSRLPPGTPMFRDVNTLTFRQLLRPTQ